MYKPFLRVYHKYLSLEIPRSPNKNAFFTNESLVFNDFITDLVKNLDSRYELDEKIILNELDEVTEVIMFIDGKFDIGFDMNS